MTAIFIGAADGKLAPDRWEGTGIRVLSAEGVGRCTAQGRPD
ncbi:hypothetical protein NYR55_04200 [Sphingomonas sp. BGYR3]|nr:hypothetical protein [Sphingomonas sp. BGYR3]MDG5487822.1 hypothetical protein [Sphingomonas sp. BGYR3]